MSDKPKQEYEIPAFLVKLCEFSERDFNLLFWFTSLISIPLFIIIFSLPITFVAWVLFSPFEAISAHIDTMVLIVSAVLSVLVQFKLWKVSKNKMDNYKKARR